MSYFDLKKYLAEGGLEAKLNETQTASDEEFIDALTKAFSAADSAIEEGPEDYFNYDLYPDGPDFEDDLEEGRGRPAGSGLERSVNFKYFTGDKNYDNILKILQRFNKLYTAKNNPTLDPRAKKPRKPFSQEELENLATLFSTKESITTKDILAAVPRYGGKDGKNTANANTFLRVMGDMGRLNVTTVSKKEQDLAAKEKRASGETPETRGRKKKQTDDSKDKAPSKSFKNEPNEEDIEDIDMSDIEDYFTNSEEDEDLFENDLFLNKFLKRK